MCSPALLSKKQKQNKGIHNKHSIETPLGNAILSTSHGSAASWHVTHCCTRYLRLSIGQTKSATEGVVRVRPPVVTLLVI